jgi:hypothetical protein
MSGTLYGVLPAKIPLLWPPIGPDASLDYTADATAYLAAEGDALATVAVSIAPSGEMAASNLIVTGGAITTFLAGAVPGRNYQVKILVTTNSNPPRTQEWLVNILGDPRYATVQAGPPANPGFGVPVTWSGGS